MLVIAAVITDTKLHAKINVFLVMMQIPSRSALTWEEVRQLDCSQLSSESKQLIVNRACASATYILSDGNAVLGVILAELILQIVHSDPSIDIKCVLDTFPFPHFVPIIEQDKIASDHLGQVRELLRAHVSISNVSGYLDAALVAHFMRVKRNQQISEIDVEIAIRVMNNTSYDIEIQSVAMRILETAKSSMVSSVVDSLQAQSQSLLDAAQTAKRLRSRSREIDQVDRVIDLLTK